MKPSLSHAPGWLWLGVLAAVCGTMSRLPAGETDADEQVKSRFARQVDRITSLEVAYKLETRSPLGSEKLRSLPEFINQAFLPRDQWREAFHGEKRYRRQIQPERIDLLAAPGEFGLGVPAEPPADAPAAVKENQKMLRKQYDRAVAAMKAQEARGIKLPKSDLSIRPLSDRDVTRVFNGRALWMKNPVSEKVDHYMVMGGGSRPNWFQISSYLAAAGLHVPDPRGEANIVKAQSLFQASERIKDPSYILDPREEVVDGSTCVVFKGRLNMGALTGAPAGELTDRIWLDRDHGLVLRRREMAQDGIVVHRWLNSALKEVEPGLWLPTAIRHEQYPFRPVDELKGQPVLVEEMKVQSLEVNQVPDALFEMLPRNGDAIDDLRGRDPSPRGIQPHPS